MAPHPPTHRILACALFAAWCAPARAEDGAGVSWPEPGGRATIARPFRGSPIAVGVSARTAGAIDSLTWGGTQFVNAHDHGREIQSAASFDGYQECLNPTEAGSDSDGAGERSTSLLTALEVGPDWLRTRAQMAYWMSPGRPIGECPKGPGPYASPRSDDVLTKHVALGAEGVDNALSYRATFTTRRPHATATFEVATGYMPPEFSRFWSLDPASGRLTPLSVGPGEQGLPVILANADGSRAMGVYSPALPQPGAPQAGYGRFDYSGLPRDGSATTKWNCVFRETDVAPGDHAYTCYVAVGTLEDVQRGIIALSAALGAAPVTAPGTPPRATGGGGQPVGRASAGMPAAGPTSGGGAGVALYVGTQPGCNAGVVSVDPAHGGCATAPVGSTLARGGPGDTPLYAGTAVGLDLDVVTVNPRHLDAGTRPIGFLAPAGSAGTPLYVGTRAGCNAGVVSTNPAHLNCAGAPIGSAVR